MTVSFKGNFASKEAEKATFADPKGSITSRGDCLCVVISRHICTERPSRSLKAVGAAIICEKVQVFVNRSSNLRFHEIFVKIWAKKSQRFHERFADSKESITFFKKFVCASVN